MHRIPTAESVASDSEETETDNSDTASEDSPNPPVPLVPGKSSPARKPPADVESTLKTVSALREKARLAAGRNEFGSAFNLATQAWEAARTHPKDVRLRQLAEELSVEIELLGKKSNAKFSSQLADPTKRLIEK